MKALAPLFSVLLFTVPPISVAQTSDRCTVLRQAPNGMMCSIEAPSASSKIWTAITWIILERVNHVRIYKKNFPNLERIFIGKSTITCDDVMVPTSVTVRIDKTECKFTKTSDQDGNNMTDVNGAPAIVFNESVSNSEDHERCHSNWVYHDEDCYLFMGDFRLNQGQAAEMCGSVGSQLVSLSTEEKDMAISELLKRHGTSINWWTSGQRLALCGPPDAYNNRRYGSRDTNPRIPMWIWNTTGTPGGLIGFTHKNFRDSGRREPSSWHGINCLGMSQEQIGYHGVKLMGNYKWYSTSCDRSTASPMCTKIACPGGWHSLTLRKCMRVVEAEVDYDDQDASCKHKGGQLLRINSYPEYRTVTGILKKLYGASSHTFGIDGGKYLGFMPTDFSPNPADPRCIRNQPCSKMVAEFAPWLPGEPKFFGKSGNDSDAMLYAPKFSLSRSNDEAWMERTGEQYGFSDHERSSKMWFICEGSPEGLHMPTYF